MTAAALLVVLGAALLMEVGGLSMAMGAFLAGVLLSTSTFKRQLEVDVEPFRGILLGLFFLAVGMSLDLSVVLTNWRMILGTVAGYMVLQALCVFVVARLTRSPRTEAIERAVIMAQGGEFAFVLYTTAAAVGLFSARANATFTAVVIVSMALAPFAVMALRFLPRPKPSMDGVEVADGLAERILLIGFGRFGQIVAQPLVAMHHRIAIIDNDPEMIQVAGRFGVKVYYGDGTRLDVLRAAGAGVSEVILVCVDDRAAATRIVELVRAEFPLAKVFARAYDRPHAFELLKAGADYQLREMFESALAFGAETIRILGAQDEEVEGVLARVRDFDRRRFEAQLLGGMMAGRDLLISNADEQAREQGLLPAPDQPAEPAPAPDERQSAPEQRQSAAG
jgi:glutathione-regulated potassium-efflux system protein KefB